MYAFIDTGGPNSGFSCMPCVFLKLRSSIRPGSLRVHKFAVSWTALFFLDDVMESAEVTLSV